MRPSRYVWKEDIADMLTTYEAEMRGNITRDVKRVEVDAASEAEARDALAKEMPNYRVFSVKQVESSGAISCVLCASGQHDRSVHSRPRKR